MKSIKEIESEVKDITKTLTTETLKKAVETRLKKRIQFLRLCKSYIETNPADSFVNKETERLANRLKLIEAGYKDWALTCAAKAPKKEYEKIMGTKQLKEQIKTLKFIKAA